MGNYNLEQDINGKESENQTMSLTLPEYENDVWGWQWEGEGEDGEEEGEREGRYYIGAIIDPNNAILESNSGNNSNQGIDIDILELFIILSNNSLVVQEVLDNIIVDEDAETETIDVSNVFVHADGDEITISVDNSNTNLLNVSLENNLLTLDYLENESGEALITLIGTANGETVETDFTVTVNPVDDVPVVNPTLDIDGNGILELQDYNLINLYASGLDESEFDFLINNFSNDLIGENAVSADANSIFSYFHEVGETILDIDGNSQVQLQDYNLINLYASGLDVAEFGFLIDNFANDLIGENATRTSADSILSYFHTTIPETV